MKADLKSNLLRVRYNPERLALPAMLEAIEAKGYEGQVVPEGAGTEPP